MWGVGIPIRNSSNRGSSTRPPVPDPAAHAGGPPTLDEFVNGPVFNSGDRVDDIDVEAGHNPKRRKLIHQASRRATGRATADQELIISLSNELGSAMHQLQESNVALNTCQQSKEDIMRMQASSRARRSEYIRRQNEQIEEQARSLQALTTRLEERERMVNDLSELNEINRLLINRYQEHEDLEHDLEDDENRRSSRYRRRYTEEIERLEQQLEDLRGGHH